MSITKKSLISMLVGAAFIATSLFNVAQVTAASTGFQAYQLMQKSQAAMTRIDSMGFNMLVDVSAAYETSGMTGLYLSGAFDEENVKFDANLLYDGSAMEGMPELSVLSKEDGEDLYVNVRGLNTYAEIYGVTDLDKTWLNFNQDDILKYAEEQGFEIDTNDSIEYPEFDPYIVFSVRDLVNKNVITPTGVANDELPGHMPTSRIDFTIDSVAFIKHLNDYYPEYFTDEDISMFESETGIVSEEVELLGTLHVGRYNHLPYHLTLTVNGVEADESVSIVMNFKDHNGDLDFSAPEEFMTIEDMITLSESSLTQAQIRAEYNPASPDVDYDGLSYSEELLWKTDPYNADTDGDGYLDGIEVANGYDPLGPGKLK